MSGRCAGQCSECECSGRGGVARGSSRGSRGGESSRHSAPVTLPLPKAGLGIEPKPLGGGCGSNPPQVTEEKEGWLEVARGNLSSLARAKALLQHSYRLR